MTLTRLTRLLVRRPSCALLALTLSTHASVAAQSRGSAATIVNVARLTYTSANGASASDSSASLVTLGTDSLGAAPVQLALSSTVGVVEATLGHAIPYTHTLTNQSDSAIVDLAIRVTLPDGVQLLEETVDVAESMSTNVQSAMLRTRAAVAATIATVDSMRVNGREVTFHAGGPLDPGESWVVRYAVTVVSPPRSTIDKTAIAWASAGAGASLVRSNDGVVSVNLRSGFALESRLIVGKVWLDADRSGRQERAEKGVAGVRVWTADGRMVVTDAQGRFSFRDVAPGRHLLRVDATTLPAGARAATRDGLTTVYMDGWTSARADIALVPAPAAPVPAPTPPHAATRTLPSLEPLNSAVVLKPGVRVRITSPPDDTVVGTNRIYVGVAATAGSPVLLFDGDSLLRSDSARIDGRLDFVAVPLDVGPHLLRVVMRDSTGVEYSDSVRVHQSGPPSRFDVGDIPTLRAESSELVEIAVTVLDEWARPVAGGPLVTVSTEGALSLDGMDADASSLGDQRRVAADGRLTLRARAGQGAGVGTLTLDGGGGGAQSWRHAAGARRTLRLAVLPSARALAITGSGQVSVGAARADFASLTAIGALARETSVKITYDSRRDALARGFFARGADPLDETRYAAYGDQSRESALTSGTRQLSVRVERKLDWLEVGDIRTENLLRGSAGPWGIGYRRSLSGASAHFVRGALGVTGFGSVTTQALVVRQIRGDGTSGPFTTVVDIRPGTERIVIEVRARDNAARVLTRTELARALDYDIDYAGGVVLLRRAIPAADAYGNPAFLVVSAEQRSGGESRLVAGIRAEGDMTRVFPSWNFDSLTVGATLVRDAAGDAALVGAQPARLVGSDVHMALAGASVRTSLLRAETGDSAATAARMEAEWAPGAWRFGGRWSRVGGGYADRKSVV